MTMLTLGEVRRVVIEALAATRPGWVKQVLELSTDDAASAEGEDISYVRNKLSKLLTAMCLDANSWHIDNLVDHWWYVTSVRHRSVFAPLLAARQKSLKADIDMLERRLPRPVYVIVASKDGKFVHEHVQVTIADYKTGEIAATVEEHPDAVWTFDPKTLTPTRVATYFEALKKRVRCARLRDIESGRI